ncbi:hypothetical protein T260_19120 [Geobacillus thermopakistaniensis]|uniref:Uncharacterized protein n=1 Tax=Geobacillus thermopakistaniensis (strain MAS1) TaxID=1408282 RepID=A0A7U9J7H6_GEOTM|nr:hypothetical protein T260_19120 [Geobacillus sp. MAS1]
MLSIDLLLPSDGSQPKKTVRRFSRRMAADAERG